MDLISLKLAPISLPLPAMVSKAIFTSVPSLAKTTSKALDKALIPFSAPKPTWLPG